MFSRENGDRESIPSFLELLIHLQSQEMMIHASTLNPKSNSKTISYFLTVGISMSSYFQFPSFSCEIEIEYLNTAKKLCASSERLSS